MAVKVHKEVQIFKRICTQDSFGDHVEEVRFPQAVCLTGVKVGAVPSHLGAERSASVDIFAKDLSTLGSARFACLAEGCELPESGTKAIRLEATVTQHVVLRGNYQTLPVALYGWVHACKAGTEARRQDGLQFQILPEVPAAEPQAKAYGIRLRHELSAPSQAALAAALARFAEVKTSEKAMRNNLLAPDTLSALLAAADEIISGLGTSPVKPEASNAAFDGDAAAEMAAGWCRTFAAVPRFGSTAEYGLSGLAAAVILAATPKYATKFLAAGGILALTRVLTSEQQIPRSVRYVLAAIEALMLACPAAACEALLGWWNPTSEENQAKIREAQELEGYQSDANQDMEDADGEGFEEEEDYEEQQQEALRGNIPQHGDASGDAEENDRPGTPAILMPEDEEQVRPESKDAPSHKDKKSSGSKKEKKDKKEKRDRRDKDKDKDKQRDGRKARHHSREPEAAGKPAGSKSQAPGEPEAHASDTLRAEDTSQASGVEDAVAAAAAKAAELAAEAAKAGPSKREDLPQKDNEARKDRDERHKSPSRGRRRDEDADLNNRGRKRRRRESRSRSRSKAPSERDSWEGEQSREKEGKARALRDGHGRQDARNRDDRQQQATRSKDERADERESQRRTRDRDRDTHRQDADRKKERERQSDRDSERDRDRDREKDRDRDRDRHRRDRDGRDNRDRASERNGHREPRGRQDDSHGRERSRKETPMDDSRDRQKLAAARDRRPMSRKDGARSRSRERAAEDSSRMPPPETPSSRGRSDNRGAYSSPHTKADESPALKSSPSARSGDTGQGRAADARAARAFEEEAEAERQKAMHEAASFGGCYPALVTTLLHLLPQRVAAQGLRILARLKVYESTARFQVAAEEAVRGHAEGTDPPLRHVHMACTQAGAALARLAQALLACPSKVQATRPSIITAFSPEGLQLEEAFDLDPWVEEALSSRCCLPLIAALLHVPKLQALHQKQAGALMPGQTPDHIQTQLAQPLHSALSHFLSALTSCPLGFSILSRKLPVVLAIMEALKPGSAQIPFLAQASLQPRSSGAEMAESLKVHVAASQAFQRLSAAIKAHSRGAEPLQETAGTVCNLLEATATNAGKRGVTAALLHTPGAFHSILSLIKEPIVKVSDSDAEGEGKPVALWQPGCIYAIRLLVLCLADGSPPVLSAWAGHASNIKSAITTVNNTPEAQQPGADKAKRDLKVLRGRSEMATLLRAQGLADMISTLNTLLPPLLTPEGQKKGLKQVDRKACLALIHNAEKAAQVETGMHLLHALLAGDLRPHACTLISHSFGLEVLERAVRCGTEALAASKADVEWVATAGDAIDVADMLANREKATAFLASSLCALSLMLQQLRLQGCELNSATLMRSILQAYSLLATAPESFLAVAGQMAANPRQPILRARQAAAACLKCWVDAENWTPDLVTAIFTGGHPLPADGPLVMLLSPSEMLHSACLLGDLFPAEWPPQGNAARMGMSHPPPSQMAYRQAIAARFEASAAVFKRLVEFAATSTSRLLRAILVRLCAKASGLGGGVGTFLAGPLMAELEACVADSLSLRGVRRMLEILVPLMYRPAMKAAFLDQGIVDVIARLLTGLMRETATEAEVTSLTTMALEIVTVLFNPDICVNALLPVTQRVIDDCPSVKEAASLIAVLLSTLTHMAGNAHISKRIIATLAAHTTGRASLRLGCLKWQTRTLGGHDSQGSKNAAQWAVTRLWQLGQEDGNEAGMREICMDVADQLEAVASSGEDYEDEAPEHTPAPQRFVAAVQAAVQTAEAMGLSSGQDDPLRSELAESCSPEALVHDAVTKMFWKNVKARATGQAAGLSTATLTLPAGQVDLPAGNLRAGLTKEKRARDAVSETLVGLVTMMPDAKRGKDESAAVKAVVGPQSDLPPVLAGPGRPKGRSFGRSGGSSGRPASMHVDDYENKAASSSAPAAGQRSAMPPVPPPRPPPGVPKPAPPKASPQKPAVQPKYPSKPIRPFGAPKPPAEASASTPTTSQLVAASPAGRSHPSKSPAAGMVDSESPGVYRAGVKPSPVASSPSDANVANLMRSPAAVAELLKDPARLQQLLEQNPALMSVLQAKMQSS